MLQVQQWQPGLNLWNGWHRWTRDGVIPWRLFWSIHERLDRVMSGQQLVFLDAVVKGLAMSLADRNKHPEVGDMPDKLRRRAFPYLFDEL